MLNDKDFVGDEKSQEKFNLKQENGAQGNAVETVSTAEVFTKSAKLPIAEIATGPESQRYKNATIEVARTIYPEELIRTSVILSPETPRRSREERKQPGMIARAFNGISAYIHAKAEEIDEEWNVREVSETTGGEADSKQTQRGVSFERLVARVKDAIHSATKENDSGKNEESLGPIKSVKKALNIVTDRSATRLERMMALQQLVGGGNLYKARLLAREEFNIAYANMAKQQNGVLPDSHRDAFYPVRILALHPLFRGLRGNLLAAAGYAGNISAWLGARDALGGWVPFVRNSVEEKNSALKAFVYNMFFKAFGVRQREKELLEALDRKTPIEATWRGIARRLTGSTCYFSAKASGEITTEDMYGADCKRPSWGPGIHNLVIGVREDVTKSDEITYSANHTGIDGVPLKVFALRVTKEINDKTDIGSIILATKHTIDDDSQFQVAPPDPYEHRGRYSLHPELKTSTDQVSLCIDGIEFIYDITGKDAVTITAEIERIKSLIGQIRANPAFADRLVDFGLALVDMEPPMTDESGGIARYNNPVWEAARAIINNQKETPAGNSGDPTYFDAWASCGFRVDVRVEESASVDAMLSTDEVIAEMESCGLAFALGENIPAELVDAYQTLTKDTAYDVRVTTLNIREYIERLKGTYPTSKKPDAKPTGIRGYLYRALGIERQEEYQADEPRINKTVNEEALLELALYIADKLPAGCGLERESEHQEPGLAIVRAIVQSDPNLTRLIEAFEAIEKKVTVVDGELIPTEPFDGGEFAELRKYAAWALNEIYAGFSQASEGKANNSIAARLIDATSKSLANIPSPLLFIAQQAFLSMGSILPQYDGGQAFLERVREINVHPMARMEYALAKGLNFLGIANPEQKRIARKYRTAKDYKEHVRTSIRESLEQALFDARFAPTDLLEETEGRSVASTTEGINLKDNGGIILPGREVIGTTAAARNASQSMMHKGTGKLPIRGRVDETIALEQRLKIIFPVLCSAFA